jgi:hypothetical protein
LCVGGGFTSANIGGPSVSAVPTGYVAKYDTVAGVWSSLGSGGGNGVNDSVYAITGIGNDLYIGGGFTSARCLITVPVNRLARYNLTTDEGLERGRIRQREMGRTSMFLHSRLLEVISTPVRILQAVNEGGSAITANGIAGPAQRRTPDPLGVSGGNGVDEVVSALAVMGQIFMWGHLLKANFTTAGAAVPARNTLDFILSTSSWSSLGSGGAEWIRG